MRRETAPGLRAPIVEQIWHAAQRQGGLATGALLGDAVPYAYPLLFTSAKCLGVRWDYAWLGRWIQESALIQIQGAGVLKALV